jgi:tRNA (guanine37-N1)-methyltransferase
MKFNILTIFPDLISHYSNESILGRGQKAGVIKINPVNLRDFSEDKHNKVDDTPYGGGPGMVMKPEPVFRALKSINALSKGRQDTRYKKQIITNDQISKKTSNLLLKALDFLTNKKIKKMTILLSPRGKQFDQRMAESFSKLDEITFICGRYEGVDQRVTDHMIDEEISVGPYVLAGGELGALIITEAVSRLIPGVLGNEESLKEETHTLDSAEYAQYTKPADFKGWKVPEVLLSGDHKKIEEWRKK